MPEIIGPASSYYVSQRLRLHFVDWGNDSKPPLLLVHGGRDHARSWDWVAGDLRNDYHVIAPDLRGHGDSAWAIGGHYTVQEFVLDIAQLLMTLDLFPVTLIGHSLGGSIVTHYASVYPDNVEKLVSIEGLGPPPSMFTGAFAKPQWERTEAWIEQVREFSTRTPKRYASIESAAARMIAENSFLSPEQARHLTVHGVARNEDGSYSWKFDNYTRVFFPQRYDMDEMREQWERISCPTLLMRGLESWAGDPEEDGRASAFANARSVGIAEAEHWVHHDQLDEFLRVVRDFLSE
ncbi:MAG: alpha/beta hydrolase [Myxococcota bacterium]|nr:alpha/beta hydrolase [Myxococcota bacterium]